MDEARVKGSAAGDLRLSGDISADSERCPLHFLFKFEYQAQFDAAGAEHELCSVFIGRSTAQVRVNRSEILASRWISAAALHEEMAGRGTTSFRGAGTAIAASALII